MGGKPLKEAAIVYFQGTDSNAGLYKNQSNIPAKYFNLGDRSPTTKVQLTIFHRLFLEKGEMSLFVIKNMTRAQKSTT